MPAPKTAYGDRKSTRLNSSHTVSSYAVFCLKKKKGGIDYLDDGVRDCRDIRIGRHDGDEPFEHLVRETRIGTGVVFSSPCLVGGRPSAGELIRAAGKGTGDDDRRFDTPPCQLTRVNYGQG